MTPKEKAKELVNRFGYYSDPYHYGQPNENIHFFRITNAKKCALICIDEILESLKRCDNTIKRKWETRWNTEVKQEIEKL